ncbi:MAG TPA: hypothetical protein VK627_09415 [Edaphobacter sp.]|nr:hypothetical protein [Edaphobacter sp.]
MAGMMMRWKIGLLVAGILVAGMSLPAVAPAEVCTTQSQMTAADRDALAAAARDLAAKVLANDVSGLRAATVPEYAKDFGGIGGLVGSTSAKLKGGTAAVEQVYLLDGTQLKPAAGGTTADAQFFCSLNKSEAEVDFLIPGLVPGRYGFAIVHVANAASPWRLSFLMRQEQGRWEMAGLYPKALTAAGHDGLWYWTQARTMATQKERWNAWLYFQQAEILLRPTNFIQSSHLEKLKAEEAAAAPPAASEGVSPGAPLVVKGADGVEYRFIGLGVDDSLGKEKIDITARLKVDQIGDAAAARKMNADAMSALLAAYPELRKPFHGVWVFAEAAGQNPFATEQAMSEIH